MLYFAYGANMNHEKMSNRCPDAKFFGPGHLDHFELVFDGQSRKRPGAVANIRATNGGRVWGGLYRISENDLKSLDLFEDYPDSYERRNFEIIHENQTYAIAIAYYRTGQPPGEPGEEYLAEVLEGARDCGLPDWYIQKHFISRAAV